MRPSLARLVRMLPRSAVSSEQKVVTSLASRPPQTKPLSLTDIMLEKQALAGNDWPTNLRIEPIIPKTAFKNMTPRVRSKLREMLRET
ncbi:hypothetical protein BDZ89DRAFT_819205 [Hymenopellis radicata]|nr:hypothetical protein BDZ89DRAFT_819205 [Hymenopellis radicata]